VDHFFDLIIFFRNLHIKISLENNFFTYNKNKAHFKSGMISFNSIAPAMTSEVIIITRQFCNYNPLYSLAASKRRDQPSTYVHVALFILRKTTLFKVITTPSTVSSFKVVSARQLRIPHYYGKCLRLGRTRTRDLLASLSSLQLRSLHRCALFYTHITISKNKTHMS